MRSREMAFALRLPREWPSQTTRFIVYSGRMVPPSIDGHDGSRGSLATPTTSRRRYSWSSTAEPTCYATSAAPDAGCCAPPPTSPNTFGGPKAARRRGTSRGSSRPAAAARRDPLAELEAREIAQGISEALATLDDRSAQIYRLSQLERMSTTAISALMGISADTVRVRQHRTRRAIAHRLAAFYRLEGSSNWADYGYDAKQAAPPRVLARRSQHASVAKP